MKSMTGFGKAIRETNDYQLDIEIKSVNQRFLDIQLRSPRILNPFELELRQLVKQTVNRGRVEVFVNLTKIGGTQKQAVIDWDLLDSLAIQLKEGVQERYGADSDFSIGRLVERLAVKEEFIMIQETEQEADLENLARETILEALRQLDQSRQTEGQALAEVLCSCQKQFTQLLDKLKTFVAVYEKDFQQKFQKKLMDFLGEEADQDRLLTELAILLERGDIHEEIDRLTIHLEKLDELLHTDAPVGRELDFLIQEMNREVNTIGSKSGAIEIKNQVVQFKTILEKIREQIQNIE